MSRGHHARSCSWSPTTHRSSSTRRAWSSRTRPSRHSSDGAPDARRRPRRRRCLDPVGHRVGPTRGVDAGRDRLLRHGGRGPRWRSGRWRRSPTSTSSSTTSQRCVTGWWPWAGAGPNPGIVGCRALRVPRRRARPRRPQAPSSQTAPSWDSSGEEHEIDPPPADADTPSGSVVWSRSEAVSTIHRGSRRTCVSVRDGEPGAPLRRSARVRRLSPERPVDPDGR